MTRTTPLRCLLLAAVFGAGTAAFTQSFMFKEYGQAQGLGNLAVRSIDQDHHGILWISTENGVFRYDGSSFVEFGRKQGLTNPFVTAAHIDSRGILWAGTPTGVYFLQDGRFHPLASGNQVLRIDDTSSITSTPEGEVLIHSVHDLYSVVGSGSTWSVTPYNRRHNSLPPRMKIYSVLASAGGGVWMGCNRTICHASSSGLQELGASAGVPADEYVALKEDSSGNIWARGEKGVIECPKGSHGFRNVSNGLPFDQRDSTYAALVEDRNGKILTPVSRGIARWNGRSWELIDPSRGLPDSNISQIFVDKEGMVWVGSHGHGLFKWLGYDEWEHWAAGQGIRNPSIFALALDRQDRIWVGNGNTIDVSDRQHERFRPFPRRLPPHLAALQSAASAADGTLWFGDFSGVLLHVTPGANTYETVRVPNGLHQLFADSSGTVWAVTLKGLYSIPAPAGKQAKPVLEDDPALKGQNIRAITEAPDRSLWVGTDGGIFHRRGHKWRKVQLHHLEIGTVVSTLAAGPNGEVWVAGKFGGAARLRTANDIVGAVQIFTVPTLSSENVNGIAIDNRGWVWIANDHGVDLLQAGRWRHFDRDEGLLWNDTDEGALLIGHDGSVWIGTSAGLSHLIHPDAAPRVRPLAVCVTDASWGGHALALGRQSKLPWQSGDLLVSFAVSSYRNESAVSYHYQLLGLEGDWAVTRDHSVRYPKLPPGHYQFKVVAEDSGLHRVSAPATFGFDVDPPWWQTRTAWALLALAVLMAGALVLRWRLRSLLKMQKRLEQLVAERTHALQAESRELLATREVLRQQATRDGLTGLLNRTAILDVLNREWKRAEREHTGLAAILADVDHFKHFNDTFGHLIGDEILHTIAARLKDGVREYDSVGRYGGEEFLIVLTGWNPEGGEQRLNLLLQSVCESPLRLGNRSVSVTSSFGVAGFAAGEKPVPVSDLLISADKALYRAKAHGRNRIEFAVTGAEDTIAG